MGSRVESAPVSAHPPASLVRRPSTPEAEPRLVNLDDLRAAAERLTGIAIRTPLAPFGRTPGGRPILLKAESLRRRVLVPPYVRDHVIAGQRTLALEILEHVRCLVAVLVPIGGGGLASGVASAVKLLRPEVRVVGVEPDLAADAAESLAGGA